MTQTSTTTYKGVSVGVRRLQAYYFAVGDLSDVYKCELHNSHETVAVKVLRGIPSDGNDKRTFDVHFLALLRRWQTLNHPNVMQCYGVSMQFGAIPGIVLPYCRSGSILAYLDATNADPWGLLLGVVHGVKYLHSVDFIHGDIRASNILIKPDGTPALMDHGLHDVTSRISHITTAGVCKPCRWMAPEVLDPPEAPGDERPLSVCTSQSDVYAMGMTFLEVITRRPPFSNRRYDTTVILAVIAGAQPLRPDIPAMSDDAWDLMQDCWKFKPEQRLTVPGVEKRVRLIYHMEMARRSMSDCPPKIWAGFY